MRDDDREPSTAYMVMMLCYYVLVWPFLLIISAALDDVLVFVRLKRVVPLGEPVWRWKRDPS